MTGIGNSNTEPAHHPPAPHHAPFLARRAPGQQPPNAIAQTRAELQHQGVELSDLTDTNPTRHGLLDPAVLDAVARATRTCHLYDPSPRGPLQAREALAATFGGHPDEYWLTASTSQAYAYLLTVLAEPGDGVGTPGPGYPLLEPLAQLTQVRLWRYPWHYLHPYGWECDTAVLHHRSTPTETNTRTRAIVAVNPGNPTGAYVDAAARSALIGACERSGATLIADEVFHPFTLPGHLPDAGAPPRLAGEPAVLTCGLDGLSKLLCAPQLKLGWIRVSGPRDGVRKLAGALDQVSDTFLPVSGPVAAALPQLLELAGPSVMRTRQRLAANLACAHEVLGEAPFRVRAAQGGWMVLVDAPRYLADDELALALLRRAHLSVHPGWFYDMVGSGTLALSLLPRPEEFRAHCERLRAAIEALG